MFSKAAKLAPAAPAKAKGKQKFQIEVVGVKRLAMLHALTTALEGVQGTEEATVKGAGLVHFLAHINAHGTKPESIDAIEGDASCSVQFKKKASNIALNDATVELLRAAGIEPHREVTTPKLWGINPAYGNRADLAAHIEALIGTVLPADYIIEQEERAKFTVTDDVLAAALKSKDANVISACTSLAVRPTLNVEANMNALLDFVRDLLVGPTPEPAVNDPQAAAAVKAA